MEAICNAVENAVDPQDRDVLDAICDQIEAYESQPSYKYRACERECEHVYIHGFHHWLWLLRDGTAAMPDKLPRSVLLAWRDADRPLPYCRCAACSMVVPSGTGRWDEIGCPTCGEFEMQFVDLTVAPAVIRFVAVNRSAAVK